MRTLVSFLTLSYELSNEGSDLQTEGEVQVSRLNISVCLIGVLSEWRTFSYANKRWRRMYKGAYFVGDTGGILLKVPQNIEFALPISFRWWSSKHLLYINMSLYSSKLYTHRGFFRDYLLLPMLHYQDTTLGSAIVLVEEFHNRSEKNKDFLFCFVAAHNNFSHKPESKVHK